jgi:hypothetical protein
MTQLRSRLDRIERLLRPQQRVHVVEVSAESVHDQEVVARAMVAQGVYPNEHDLVVLLKNYTDDQLIQPTAARCNEMG